MQLLNTLLKIILSPIQLLFSLFRRIIPGMRRLPSLSPAYLAALILFVFLLTVQISFLIVAAVSKEGVDFVHYLHTLWISIPIVFVTPFLVYFFVKLLLKGESSPYPDLDDSWNAGLQALAEQGIELKDTPLFLVLGVRDSLFPERLMESSGRKFQVSNIYGETPSLQWFANEDEVYVFIRRAGSLSLLARKGEQHGRHAAEVTSAGFMGTIRPGELDSDQNPNLTPFDDSFGGSTGLSLAGTGTSTGSADEEFVANQTLDARTLDVEERERFSAPSPGPHSEKLEIAFGKEELYEAENRLEYLCNLIAQTRYPVCPLNGVVTTLAIEQAETYPDQMANHIKADLACISRTARLRCAVTALITDLDSDLGALELSDRLGIKFKDRRFGKGFRIWNEPTNTQIRAVAIHACASFDQWIRKLFQTPASLQNSNVAGNRRLYRLLSRIHLRTTPALQKMLPNGFGFDASAGEDDEDSLQFGGCYFAGNGPDESRQFFVRGFFDRVVDGQSELEWNGYAFRSEERISLLANLALLIGIAALATLGLLVARQMGWLPFWQP
jgi:hypothetical protein